ncbi:hypothetical protein A3K64_03165 [Candidatus Micrarchaeota archaeon RBG_16_36_9]|nr:MAG: hypothetical protein A3K64_03165 [Candidatus Micrarchaeota archaeon RBG_16_36_9]
MLLMTEFGENEDIRPHTIKKWRFLRKYLEAYTKIVSNKSWDSFFYIDGFAGKGKYGEYEGSPLIALKLDYLFTNYIFIEEKKENIKKLESIIRQLSINKAKIFRNDKNNPSRDVDVKISFKRTDVNSYLQENLCKDVPDGKICFIFLDPTGTELSMKALEACAKRTRVELLINFPVSGVIRNMETPQSEKTITALFGSDEWKHVRSDSKKGENLAEIYVQSIRKFFRNIKYEVIKNEKNSPVYYLIFATNSDVGFKIMNNVMQDGQKSLFKWMK